MKIKLFTTAAITALLFASCNNDNEVSNVNDGRVNFSSEITLSTTTRVQSNLNGVSTWNQGDNIGIYMVEKGTFNIAENAKNIHYKATESGTRTSFNPLESPIYYPVNAPEKVGFIAYYPYAALTTDWVYPVDVSDQSSLANIDLMYAQADNSGVGYNKTSSNVNLEFSHQLAQLIIGVEFGEGVDTDDWLESVSIEGMNTTANFDLMGGTGLTNLGTPLAIEAYTYILDLEYMAILLPNTLNENNKVVFTTESGEKYIWNISQDLPKLEAGHIYDYKITLTKHEVQVSGTILDWTVGETIPGIAE